MGINEYAKIDYLPELPSTPMKAAPDCGASYGEENFRRLVALKDKYDPENVFSLNANIPPSATYA